MTKSALIRFIVGCEKGSPGYFVVEIHPTKRRMNAAAHRFECDVAGSRTKYTPCVAGCYSYRVEKGRRIMPEIGRIFFNEENLHPMVLSHEFTHAAITFCRRRRLNPMKKSKNLWDAEERMATAVGWMMWQFYQNQPNRTSFVKGSPA